MNNKTGWPLAVTGIRTHDLTGDKNGTSQLDYDADPVDLHFSLKLNNLAGFWMWHAVVAKDRSHAWEQWRSEEAEAGKVGWRRTWPCLRLAAEMLGRVRLHAEADGDEPKSGVTGTHTCAVDEGKRSRFWTRGWSRKGVVLVLHNGRAERGVGDVLDCSWPEGGSRHAVEVDEVEAARGQRRCLAVELSVGAVGEREEAEWRRR
jgi:hypothetical protein